MSDRFNLFPPNADDDNINTDPHSNGASPNGLGAAGNNGRVHPLAGHYNNGRNGTGNNLKVTNELLPEENRPAQSQPPRREQRGLTGPLPVSPEPIGGQRVLQGALTAFSPGSLLSLLNIQKQTGWLYLSNNGMEGYIYVEKGEVYDAGVGRVSTGALAVFQLFGWKHGEFRFEIGGSSPAHRTIEASLPVLQVRATLWLDSMNKYSSVIPSPSHRISIAAEPRSEVVIEPYQWAVLTKIVRAPLSITELAGELGQDLMTVTRITVELVKMGVAVVLPPE